MWLFIERVGKAETLCAVCGAFVGRRWEMCCCLQQRPSGTSRAKINKMSISRISDAAEPVNVLMPLTLARDGMENQHSLIYGSAGGHR